VLVGYSIGTITFLASRLFNWQTPRLLRVLTNYISAVKLYTQRRRFGPGLPGHPEEFLDAVGDPPRVSIRRRMIRAIADVAANRYDRWYILAHSQGSAVAFNGLMETAYAWPGYLDERRWKRLCRAGFAGPARGDRELPRAENSRTLPPRPSWASDRDIVFRDIIFERFRGFLTFGSPLAKFAAIWPALVPKSRERAFRPKTPWLNLYDPIDPVSGRLFAFNGQSDEECPHATDLGYAAGWILLLAHLNYFTRREGHVDAATATVHWLLTDCTGEFRAGRSSIPGVDRNCPSRINSPRFGWNSGDWFEENSIVRRTRRVIAYGSWVIALAALACLGAIILPLLLEASSAAIRAIWSHAFPRDRRKNLFKGHRDLA
jgi:hypothetical protein